MFSFFRKPYRYAAIFSLLLIGAVSFVLLDVFVIPKEMDTPLVAAPDQPITQSDIDEISETDQYAEPVFTENSYQDSDIKIFLSTERCFDTQCYYADIVVKNPDLLKTAFAKDKYGKNIKQKTSVISEAHNAIIAVNGDYYGFRPAGYVLRNGVLYRSTARLRYGSDALCIDAQGDFFIIDENTSIGAELVGQGVRQIFSFGPTIIEGGTIREDKVARGYLEKDSHPRVVIAQIEPFHYLFFVCDGRSGISKGLSLTQVASLLEEKGCETAYNLDGGGSTTLYFNGQVINKPSEGDSERAVSDIVYIGY